jgi:multiple sugar transport system permease protein
MKMGFAFGNRQPAIGRRPLSPMAREDRMTFWCFLSPWIIGFILFGAGPILASILLSFTDYSLFNAPKWVGLANYRELFSDPLIWKSLWNTLFYVIFAVPLSTAGSCLLAVLLNQKVRGIAIWRTIFYLPTIVSGVAMGVLWRWIFHPEIGLANTMLGPVLSFFNIDNPQWLLDPVLAKPAYIFMSLWGIGGGMIIFLAALQGIPEHLYEAAELDGAGPVRKFFNITLPMLSPVILFSVTMGTIGSFQIFAQAYVMSGRGPDNSTLFYVMYLFDQAFRYFRMGYGAAMAWVLFAIVLCITVIKFTLAKRFVYYEGEE